MTEEPKPPAEALTKLSFQDARKLKKAPFLFCSVLPFSTLSYPSSQEQFSPVEHKPPRYTIFGQQKQLHSQLGQDHKNILQNPSRILSFFRLNLSETTRIKPPAKEYLNGGPRKPLLKPL